MSRRITDLGLLAALSVLWTWPLALHFHDHIPGTPGDNFSFLWNLWWMRHALSDRAVGFFHSNYLFSPFGVDLINHPHTLLQGLISATVLSKLSVIEAENLYIIFSVFLNAAAAYALVFDITRQRRLALLAGVAFGGSPYIAAHLFGHFDLLTAWVLPLFALFVRRALTPGPASAKATAGWIPAVGCGLCVAVAAYNAYYYVVYLALFALAYTLAWWNCFHLAIERRGQSPAAFSIRLLAVAAISLDLFVMLFVLLTGGTTLNVAGAEVSVRGLQNPLLVMWMSLLVWALARRKVRIRFERPAPETFWRGTQALLVAASVFALTSMPLIMQAFRLALSGRYVSQVYFWRSAPRGIDLAALVSGNPFHPVFGGAVSRLYAAAGLNRIEQVGWLGIVPIVVLMIGRGKWLDREEARCWKCVLVVFLVWALGPFLMVAGMDLGLPLPETLARFVPVVENARVPGRAMVGVYLALGVLMALKLAGLKASPTSTGASRTSKTVGAGSSVGGPGSSDVGPGFSPAIEWALIVFLALDYLNAPVPLTPLDRPAIYQQLASVEDGSPVIEVPFGVGDGLTTGVGAQDRRILYYATIHGHPLVGGFIGRMPPGVAQAYETMPIVGNLLRLSSGQPAIEDELVPGVPFRYLVLHTKEASPELIAFVHAALDLDLIGTDGDRELYAVQGAKPLNLRASK